MKRIIALLGVALLCAACGPGYNDFKRLEGTWQRKGTAIYEHWVAREAGGYFDGISFKIQGKDTILLELLRLERLGEDWIYLANPEGGGPTAFTLAVSYATVDTSLTDSSTADTTKRLSQWRFANPEHDYPKEIIYQLQSDSLLQVSISAGPADSVPRRWSYRKIAPIQIPGF